MFAVNILTGIKVNGFYEWARFILYLSHFYSLCFFLLHSLVLFFLVIDVAMRVYCESIYSLMRICCGLIAFTFPTHHKNYPIFHRYYVYVCVYWIDVVKWARPVQFFIECANGPRMNMSCHIYAIKSLGMDFFMVFQCFYVKFQFC